MDSRDILYFLVNVQFMETVLLLLLLWAFYVRLSKREFYWWWLWVWATFAIYLGAGRLALMAGAEWPVAKGVLTLVATGAGFAQPVMMWLGVESIRADQRPPRFPPRAVVTSAVILGAVVSFTSLGLDGGPMMGFSFRAAPRQALLAAALLYCAWIFLRKHPSRTLASQVTGISCLLYGVNQALYTASSAWILLTSLGVMSPPAGPGTLARVMVNPTIFLLDLVWQAGIVIGVVLMLMDEFVDSSQALRLSEARYRALVESSQGLICTHDMNGVLLSVNPAAARMLGYEPEEMIGQPADGFLAPWSLDRVDEYLGYVKRDRIDSGLLRAKTRDGRELVWVYQSALLEEEGREPIVLGHAQDITDRIRAEDALRESEARQRALLHAMPDMMFVIRRDGTVIDFKGSREFDLSIPPSEFLGRTLHDFQPKELADRSLQYVQQALETRDVVIFEYRYPSPGDKDMFEARLVAAGEDRVISIVRDITARKRTEEALLRSETALEEAQRIAHVGSWDWDLVYDKFICSKELYRLFGLPERDKGEFEDFLQVIHPEDRPRVESAIADALELGNAIELEYRLVLADRKVRQVQVRGEVLCDEKGKPIRMIGTALDVTEPREVEKMKDEFISIVSHEVRTPLTSIRGSLGLLASGKLGNLTEKGRRMLEVAVTNTDRLVRLLNNILDLERMKTGKVEVLITDWAVGDVLREACDIMQPSAERAGVRLEAEAADSILEADRDRVVQVLTNLLSNAIKFSPAGETVFARASQVDSEIVFEIEDCGRGVPAEKEDSIFERFQQVDRSDGRQKGGAGLGLAICRSIVEEHGGRIWVKSNPDRGSTFSFSLPLTPAPQKA